VRGLASRWGTGAALVGLSLGLTGCNRNHEAQGGLSAPNHGSAEAITPAPHQLGRGPQDTNVSQVVPTNGAALNSGPGQNQALAQKVHVALSTGTTGTTGAYSDDMLLKIQVVASNGWVTLVGTVPTDAVRTVLGERARAVDGVRGVDNRLTLP
ncbi:MAG: BON domain-containing protein, partial [Verrucomicrobiota bacterium]